MSLLAEIQRITEHTYKPTGANFEDFLIDHHRFVYLSRRARYAEEMSCAARVFFRTHQGCLYVGLYYSRSLIDVLEAHDPRSGLSERNITAFCTFVEEVNHAVHGSLKYLEGRADLSSEAFVKDLELQSRIDTYFVLKYFLAYFNGSRQLEAFDRLWLRHHLFECEDTSYDSEALTSRYSEAKALGEKYTRFVDAIPPPERLAEIRGFRQRTFEEKRNYINMLP